MQGGNFLEGVSREALAKGRLHSGRFFGYERENPDEKKYKNSVSPFDDYLTTFEDVRPNTTLWEIKLRAEKEKRPVSMLDLMSSGGAFDKDWLAGVAITLTDLRKDKSAKNVRVIEGNILQREPWVEANQWLKENKQAGFDLAFCVPEFRGFRALGFYEQAGQTDKQLGGLYFAIMNEAYKRLNEGGMLLFQWPGSGALSFLGITLEQWYENQKELWFKAYEGKNLFKKIKTYRMQYPLGFKMTEGPWDTEVKGPSFYTVKIVKSQGAPTELYNNPFLNELL